jgi:hypothetical protein
VAAEGRQLSLDPSAKHNREEAALDSVQWGRNDLFDSVGTLRAYANDGDGAAVVVERTEESTNPLSAAIQPTEGNVKTYHPD